MKLISLVCGGVVILALLTFATGTRAQQLSHGADAGGAGVAQTLLPAAGDGSCVSPAIADDSAGHGFNLANLDRSVKPCDNFFQFADGGWIKSHPIPEYPSFGSFTELAESNRDKLRTILEAAAKNTAAAPGSIDQKIGDFYFSCMDEPAIEKAGIEPLKDDFALIAKISSAADLQAEIVRLHRDGAGAVFGFGAIPDFKNSGVYIAVAGQGLFGVPYRDYYLKTDDKSVKLREAYVKRVANMLVLLGDDAGAAAAEAKIVMAIETKLAQASMTRVERRNPDNVYHKMDRAALKALTPDFNWDGYFHTIGHDSIEAVNVAQPDLFQGCESRADRHFAR